MKNYKLTHRGKILLILSFIGFIGSYFLKPIVFYTLSAMLIIVTVIEIISHFVGISKNNRNQMKEKSEKKEAEASYKNIQMDDERTATIEEKTLREEGSEAKVFKEILDSDKKDYENSVDDFERIDEDIQSMEKDLEDIGKKATALQKTSIENYYEHKRVIIDSNITKENEESMINEIQNFEEVSLLDSIIERIKEILSFKRYKKGNLVLHNHFGIGKIVGVEDTMKVSFINDQIEEIIEFEYDKNNKIPELNLFKAPKGEDERQYYYNFKRDVSDELLNVIGKIDLNLPDIEYQWNIFLKNGDRFEKYDFIAISDQVHLFTRAGKDEVQVQLLENLLADFQVNIKIHEVAEYSSISSILLKSKIKGIMPLEKMHAVNERIAENNIKDFNERMQYSSRFKNEK